MVSPYLLRPLRSLKEAVGVGEAEADVRPEAGPIVAEHVHPPAAAALHEATNQARTWPRVVWSNETPCSGADRPGKD